MKLALPKDPKKRRLVMFGALGAGVLIVLLVIRRGHGQPPAAAADQPAAPDTAAAGTGTAPSDPLAGSGVGGVDNSAQLASFETDLLNQLPDTISSAIAAGLANGLPAPDPVATTGDPIGATTI